MEEIRRVKLSDANALQELFSENSEKEIRDYLRVCLKKIANGEMERFVLIVNGKTVVNCQVTLGTVPNAHIAEVKALVVHPEFKKEGYAEKMMKHVEEMMKKRRVEIIKLSVSENNTPAKKLYGKLGYKKYGFFEKGYKRKGNYQNLILLKKEL